MNDHIFDLINKEKQRQETTIDLIASENYASPNVLKACGSVLTNKYAEGYPGKRYYGGCGVIDQIENVARELGKKLFNAEHVNVQPHSGSSANMAVYASCLNPGDKVIAMDLSAGGHLTHGFKRNFSGQIYNFFHYGVCRDYEQIDYDAIERLAVEHNPKMIVAGTSAYSRIVDYPRLRAIADGCGAILFIDMAHIAGLVAGKVHPNPVLIADIVSLTTHKTLRGPRGGMICCKAKFAAQIDRAVMPGCQGGPLMNTIAAKAVAFEEALRPGFIAYQQQVLKNAQAMAEEFQRLGYRVISGGTDTHLFLLDVTAKDPSLTGKLVQEVLERCNIVLNKNGIPFDTLSPMVTSGVRIGTPAMTTRGCKEAEAVEIVRLIDEAICHRNDERKLEEIKEEVLKICRQFIVYEGR